MRQNPARRPVWKRPWKHLPVRTTLAWNGPTQTFPSPRRLSHPNGKGFSNRPPKSPAGPCLREGPPQPPWIRDRPPPAKRKAPRKPQTAVKLLQTREKTAQRCGRSKLRRWTYTYFTPNPDLPRVLQSSLRIPVCGKGNLKSAGSAGGSGRDSAAARGRGRRPPPAPHPTPPQKPRATRERRGNAPLGSRAPHQAARGPC